ncbi:IS630 family transposase [Photorhabdus khanii]|uniref:IS630 family transposase n=1 Tax=Photorhabdus khanii TaxID=1004150 RepID=A0A7C9KI99_9GAMM|nr:IS630 family transposase [Photorhabdus khanii]MQL49085.1 IS630 family transposase [Photorhabdus khanii]
MPIIAPIPRNERRLMQKVVHQTQDKNHARRLMAMLMLHRGDSVTQVAKTLCAARSSVNRWINWFTLFGIDGLKSLPAGRPSRWNLNPLFPVFSLLLQYSPQQFGWLRSRWSLELLAINIQSLFNITLPISTLYRYFSRVNIVWRRAAPTLKIPDAEYPVFYEDEVDIAFNPKIGADWCLKGQQKRIPIPGQNQKYYLAGSVDARTGKVDYVGGQRKNSDLFISLLEKLKHTYRQAKKLTLILDNYVIHKSCKVQNWLKKNPKFHLLFLPVYSSWLNKIERLWQSLHETVTRNHTCQYMWQLLGKVNRFMAAASLFPGSRAGTVKV